MIRIVSAAVVLAAFIALIAAFAPAGPGASAALEAEAALAPNGYAIDGVHSSVVYRIKHNSVAYFYGRFNDISGTIRWDAEDPANSAINIEIKAESVYTGNERRDGHLRSADFFNVREHPTITFTSKKIERKGDSGDSYTVTGDLALHGVTKTITADLDFTGSTTTARGTNLIGLETVFTIKRSEFNMNYGIEQGALGDEVRIMVGIEAGRS